MTDELIEIAQLNPSSSMANSPQLVHGVAIGEDEVTVGPEHTKLWPASALQEAAESLEGVPLNKNHNDRDVDAVIGQVVKAGYKDGVGVIFEAEVDDADVAEKIERGRLEVSVHATHRNGGINDDGQMVVEDIEFLDLSVVPRGAAEGNKVTAGRWDGMATALSEAALSAAVEELDAETEEVTLGSIHSPNFSDTTRGEWEAPNLEDFPNSYFDDEGNPDFSEVDNHFLYAEDGFPPSEYGELKFPVVGPDGQLNLNALQSAKSYASRSGLSDEEQDDLVDEINRLASVGFDKDWSEDENPESTESDDESDAEETPSSAVEDDSLNESNQSDTMTDETETTNDELDEDVDTLQNRVDELEETVSELREENEALLEEVESVRMEYAEALAGNSAFSAEELASKFSVEELAQKYEESDEAELTSTPAPQSGDVEETELDTSDEAEERQEEIARLEAKVEKFDDLGMTGAKKGAEDRLAELKAE